ncbi:MAG: hypothetical protein JRI36_11390 [Deltaproteobacteria bacterium]|nr:hypothetical protein [Deltaproteobacteria bacterium]
MNQHTLPRHTSHDVPEILSCEKARLRALSLSVIRSVVRQHQGNVEQDETSDYVDIDVPDTEATACAEEIGQQMGLICHQVYRHVDALFKGKVLLPKTVN